MNVHCMAVGALEEDFFQRSIIHYSSCKTLSCTCNFSEYFYFSSNHKVTANQIYQLLYPIKKFISLCTLGGFETNHKTCVSTLNAICDFAVTQFHNQEDRDLSGPLPYQMSRPLSDLLNLTFPGWTFTLIPLHMADVS